MATDINNPGRVVTANYSPLFTGLELKAGSDHYTISEYHADDAAVFQAGMLVKVLDTGLVTVCDSGDDVVGVATLNRTNALDGVEVDLPVTVTAGATVSLGGRNGPIDEDTLRVHTAEGATNNNLVTAMMNPGTLVADTFYSVVGNTLVWAASLAGSGISNGDTVYVSFRFPLSVTDLNLQGQNLYGRYDAIARYGEKVPVIQPRGGTRFFTMQYDPSEVYTHTGAGRNLYAGNNSPNDLSGLFTNDSALATQFVGYVFQPPRADYPLLGVMFTTVEG